MRAATSSVVAATFTAKKYDQGSFWGRGLHTVATLRCLQRQLQFMSAPHPSLFSQVVCYDVTRLQTNLTPQHTATLLSRWRPAVTLALMLHGLCPPSGWICITTLLLAARPSNATAAAPRKRSSQGRARVTGDILAQKEETGHSPLAATTNSTHDTRERTARRRKAIFLATLTARDRKGVGIMRK